MIDQRFNELISHLWRGGKYAYYWTPDDGNGEKYTYWLTARGEITVPKLFLNRDAYFSVNPSLMRRSEHERARITDIGALNCLYVEFDCATPEDKAVKLAEIDTWQHKPACVVDSGGGLHCYLWTNETFLLTDDATRQRAIDLQYAFVEMMGGDDGAKDLARVLRIPGTTNHKAHHGPQGAPVCIVRWQPTITHKWRDLDALLKPWVDARRVAQTDTPRTVSPVSLSDNELLEVLFSSKNGKTYERLWQGDLSDASGDHSRADQILCNGLAWLTGRDTGRMDSLFRQSGLMREKWETKSYRERTLNNAAKSAQTIYEPRYVDVEAVAVAEAAINLNGNHKGSQPSKEGAPTMRGYKLPSNPLTADYINALQYLGFHFRLNLLDDIIEVNSERLTDLVYKTIRNKIRDLGFKTAQLPAMEDAYWEEAGRNAYHPIKDYLAGLSWNGDDHIRLLARHFKDKHDPIVYPDGTSETVFYVWLKRWLVAAVAKVYSGNTINAQNAVLVLEGGQNLGKSTFARWLCSGVPQYFIEKSIEPDSKEDERRLASHWIWEIGELGATTRKADREALKSFLTREKCTFRNPYAKEDSKKAALASFIGTVNNEGGFLQDATGSRRFMTVGLSDIQHSYIDDIDIGQVWAQAFDLYRRGEWWRLTAEETAAREEVNSEYKVEDVYEGWLLRFFEIDPERGSAKTAGWFTTTQEIVSELRAQGVTDNTSALSMRLAATMKELGLEKTRQFRGGPRGYWGVKIKPQ